MTAGRLVSLATGAAALLALISSASVSAASGAPAASSSGCASFASDQALLESGITARTSLLQKIQARADASRTLAASDKSTILAALSSAESGMNSLLGQVEAVQDSKGACITLSQDASTMVKTYRVYMVIAPQSDLTIVADHESAIEHKLTAAETTIQKLIAAEHKKGRNVSGAEAAFAAFQSSVSTAQSSLSNVSASTLLSQTPADCETATGADTCPSTAIFKSAYQNEVAVRSDFLSAKSDLVTLIADLR